METLPLTGNWILLFLLMTVPPLSGQYCDRILISGLDPQYVGQVQFETEYQLQNFTWNDFPVYKTVDSNVYLYYNSTTGYLMLGLGKGKGQDLGFGAVVRDRHATGNDLAGRLRRGRYPFSAVIDRWIQYDYWRRGWYFVKDANIQILCLDGDSDFQRKCSNDRLYFNVTVRQVTADGRLNVLNNPENTYLTRVNRLYRNWRPVYQMYTDGSPADYLYFYQYESGEGFWQVGSDYDDLKAHMAVQDSSNAPEYISATWKVYVGETWESDSSLFLKCKGVEPQGNISCADGSNPCQNGGTCRNNQRGEVVCDCQSEWKGPLCEARRPNCTLQGNLLPGLHNNHILVQFCDPSRSSTSHWFSICQKSASTGEEDSEGTWVPYGRCEPPTTIDPTTTRRYPVFTTPFDHTYWQGPTYPTPSGPSSYDAFVEWLSDNDAWLLPVCITLAILLQIGIPICVWFYRLNRQQDNSIVLAKMQVILEEMKAMIEEHRAMFEDFHRRHPEPEAMYSQETREELKRIEQETEVASTKKQQEYMSYRKQLAKHKPSYCRIMSMDYYISMWIWLLLIIIFESTGLSYANAFIFILRVVACCMVVFLHLFILIECATSQELQYLSKMGDVSSLQSRIDNMRASQPDVAMSAEAYHYETRTRVVYYTDANGNSNSRLETYQEKVVTANIVEPFTFRYWRDCSQDQVEGISQKGVTKVSVECLVVPGDTQTQEALRQAYEQFKETHQYRDTFVDFDLNNEVAGYEKRLAAFKDPSSKPWWMNQGAYWGCSLIGFTWPFRILFRTCSHSTCYVLIKHFYMDNPNFSRASVHSELASYNPHLSVLVAKLDIIVVQVSPEDSNPESERPQILEDKTDGALSEPVQQPVQQCQLAEVNMKSLTKAEGELGSDKPVVVEFD